MDTTEIVVTGTAAAFGAYVGSGTADNDHKVAGAIVGGATGALFGLVFFYGIAFTSWFTTGALGLAEGEGGKQSS